ncbi:MAG: type II secretion system protein [Clostridiaceae bacterium]
MKLLKSNKGMTLIETIISLAVLGIVSVPLMAVFTNTAVIVKKTDERLEINAVTRIIKENVINSVKYGGSGNAIYTYNHADLIDLQSGPDANGDGDLETAENLEIKDSKDIVNEDYIFDAERTMDFNTIANPEDPSGSLADTCEYLITVKTKNTGNIVQKLRILINRID